MTLSGQFGPELHRDGVTFRLWAPAAQRVDLLLDRAYPMQPQAAGWYETTIARAGAGTLYKFRIDGEVEVPDPASHYQPQDVFGPSEVVDHDRFEWRAAQWRGRPWADAVVLEIHVGTFTPGGTFRSAIERLDHVADAGVTAIELMPIGDFAGRRNWGYDGVLLYAPDSAYGRPDDLRELIDAAHARGLMVFLDVVYNHFGPEGNYLQRYAPEFFARSHTPWGHAIDYRVPQVRAFAIGNALHWLERYRFDGLRLDAVHAIVEPGEPSILRELSRTVGEFAEASGRLVHLVLENDDNRASLLDPLSDPPDGKYRAQWNDDYHHAWHVLLTGECKGYYRDYAEPSRPHCAGVCPQALPIKARFPVTGKGGVAARRPLPCHLSRSSDFCRITTRSEIALWVIASRDSRRRPPSLPPSPSLCSLRCRRCCSWGRSGDPLSRFRSSAIFAEPWRMPFAKAGARSSSRPMPSSPTAFPTRWRT